MKKSLQKIYNEFAQTYEENRGCFDIDHILEAFYSQFEAEANCLLDLGCGSGEPVAQYFIDRQWSVMGVDFSQSMIDLAKKYTPKMQTICAEMSEVVFEPEQFDAITACYSLFHLPTQEHVDLLSRTYQWLRPQGKMLFTYATEAYTGCKEFDGYKNFMGKSLYYGHKTPQALYKDLESIGFEILAADYHTIAEEKFLWLTITKS